MIDKMLILKKFVIYLLIFMLFSILPLQTL